MLKKENHCWTLLKGKKRAKSAAIFGVLGQLDELVAVLGLARAFSRKKKLKQTLLAFQEDLIRIGGMLSSSQKQFPLKEKTAHLEEKILKFKDPAVKEFSRPGINKTSAFLHLSRAIARRLERRVVNLKKRRYQPLVAYLNRLSLLLFWLAVREEKRR